MAMLRAEMGKAGGRMRAKVQQFLLDEEGSTAIEYTLIAGFISVTALTGGAMIADELYAIFQRLVAKVQAVAKPG